MINCQFFHEALLGHGIDFFAGVPDSLLKDFCAYIADHTAESKHIIAANEGAAVALACGHYLATGKVAVVYMQNSGQGNAANPLISLADPEVYSIPVLLVIGWRGQPGKKDEPQHLKQGQITLDFLQALGISYQILPDTDRQVESCLEQTFRELEEKSAPVALVVQKDTFEPYKLQKDSGDNYPLSREEAIKLIVDKLDPEDVVVSTTGKASRELYEYRDALGADHNKDFLTVGSMGHASQIALGIALAKPHQQVFCLDGDGALIMHMGSAAIIGLQKVPNFKHVVLNNGAHDSVGGQPTVGYQVRFVDIAKACGYQRVLQAQTSEQLAQAMEALTSAKGPALLEIRIKKGARADLGRPKISPKKNKSNFMKFLAK